MDIAVLRWSDEVVNWLFIGTRRCYSLFWTLLYYRPSFQKRVKTSCILPGDPHSLAEEENSRSLELNSASPSPLQFHSVLSQVLDCLSSRDLRTCRLVSRDWNASAVDRLRRRPGRRLLVWPHCWPRLCRDFEQCQGVLPFARLGLSLNQLDLESSGKFLAQHGHSLQDLAVTDARLGLQRLTRRHDAREVLSTLQHVLAHAQNLKRLWLVLESLPELDLRGEEPPFCFQRLELLGIETSSRSPALSPACLEALLTMGPKARVLAFNAQAGEERQRDALVGAVQKLRLSGFLCPAWTRASLELHRAVAESQRLTSMALSLESGSEQTWGVVEAQEALLESQAAHLQQLFLVSTEPYYPQKGNVPELELPPLPQLESLTLGFMFCREDWVHPVNELPALDFKFYNLMCWLLVGLPCSAMLRSIYLHFSVGPPEESLQSYEQEEEGSHLEWVYQFLWILLVVVVRLWVEFELQQGIREPLNLRPLRPEQVPTLRSLEAYPPFLTQLSAVPFPTLTTLVLQQKSSGSSESVLPGLALRFPHLTKLHNLGLSSAAELALVAQSWPDLQDLFLVLRTDFPKQSFLLPKGQAGSLPQLRKLQKLRLRFLAGSSSWSLNECGSFLDFSPQLRLRLEGDFSISAELRAVLTAHFQTVFLMPSSARALPRALYKAEGMLARIGGPRAALSRFLDELELFGHSAMLRQLLRSGK